MCSQNENHHIKRFKKKKSFKVCFKANDSNYTDLILNSSGNSKCNNTEKKTYIRDSNGGVS